MLRHFYNVIEVQYDTNLLVFDIFHSRAAWWLQRRPRKRFRRQRQQEPRPDLLRRTHKRRVHIAHRTASHQDFFPPHHHGLFFIYLTFFFFGCFFTCTEDFYLLCFGRGGEGNSAFRTSENRLFYLPLQHLLPVFFSCVVIKKM